MTIWPSFLVRVTSIRLFKMAVRSHRDSVGHNRPRDIARGMAQIAVQAAAQAAGRAAVGMMAAVGTMLAEDRPPAVSVRHILAAAGRLAEAAAAGRAKCRTL